MLKSAAVLALSIAAAAHAGPCRVTLRASVALGRAGPLLTVPVQINGETLDFILDTGAERSVVSLEAADRLHLARDEWVSTDIVGAGGRDRRRLGRPASLALGGLALRRHTVAADNSVVVGPIPDSVDGHAVAGFLGEDFLSPFDVAIDPGAGTLSLYDVSGCSGRFLPWTGAYTAAAAGRPIRNVITLPIRIADHTLTGMLDSGSMYTVVTLPGIVALGLPGGGSDHIRGFGPNSVVARAEHFPSVQIGNGAAGPAELMVSPVKTMRSIGALIGADWFGTHRVWISWATNQVFSAPL